MRAAVVALLLVVAASCACRAPGAPPRGRRVVLVAAEGAGWPLTKSLIDRGELPTLARLLKDGSMGMVLAPEPLSPAVVWTTLATGRPRETHGITFDAVRGPGDRELRGITSDRRRVPAIWSIASARDITVGLAAWPATWPAESLKGFVVADSLEPDERAGRGDLYPPAALGPGGEAGEALGLDDAMREAAARHPVVAEAFARDLATLSRAATLMRVHQPRLLMVRLEAIDAISHRLWQYHDHQYLALAASRGAPAADEEAARLSPSVTDAYRFVDRCVERLMERLPTDTALLIASGWGMRGVRLTDYVHVDLDGLLARVAERGLPEAGGMFALDDTGNVPRGLYVPEPRGGPSGDDTGERGAAGVRKVADALGALTGADGTPLFRSVAVTSGPRGRGPAIEVIENLDIDPVAPVGPGGIAASARDLFRRYGEDFAIHDPQGWLLAAGDGIARGHSGWTAGLLDVAPTLLALLEIPASRDMPGHAISPLLAAPPRDESLRIESYDDALPLPAPARRDDVAARRAMERLRASGHLR